MDIKVDFESAMPIYAQLVRQIRHEIVLGNLAPGEQLPTVRQLAVNLRVNPNTVSRAYLELERAGLISTRQGRGTFVNVREEVVEADRERQDRLEEIVQTVLGEAALLGLTPEEFVQAVQDYIARHSRDLISEEARRNGTIVF
ncbi:MAG: GntR family transcriptional regulator [Armatimonadetes bacterium]|nr:GntR family transcriptional regulator [Armatimonadota bacterium]